jgi:hypothetical protein
MRHPDPELGLPASPQANEGAIVRYTKPPRICVGRVLPRGMALEDRLLLASSGRGFREPGIFCCMDSDEG